MRVAELKDLERERGLRGYSQLRKAELIAFLGNRASGLQNHDQCLLPLQFREDPQDQLGALDPPPPHGVLLPHLQCQLGLDQIDQDSQSC